MARLESDQDPTQIEVLDSVHTFGRSRTCRSPLSDGSVSGIHACLRWEGLRWSVTDLGSRNGTFVNGQRLPSNGRSVLTAGDSIAFGDPKVAWRLVDASEPAPVAIPVGPGKAAAAVQDCIYLEDGGGKPAAMISRGDGSWMLEAGELRRPLADRDLFDVGEQRWQFFCPEITGPTTTQDQLLLASFVLCFRVSKDEEEVDVSLVRETKIVHLGTHAFFYLLLLLARKRLADASAGPAQASDPGWLHREELCAMLKCDDTHKNVHIFRIRKRFADSGIADAAQIIERRRQHVRLGVERVEIHRA